MPTILDLLGVARRRRPCRASSLMPLATRRAAGSAGASARRWYPRYHYGWSELTAVRDGRYKFIAAPRRELYDIEADPGETARSLARRTRAWPTRSSARLRDMAARTAAPAAPQQPARRRSGGRGAAARARLRRRPASARATLADRPRGDPKDKIASLQPAEARRAATRSTGRLDDGDRQGPRGAGRRSRGDRGATRCSATCTVKAGRRHRRDRRLQAGAGDRPGARRRGVESWRSPIGRQASWTRREAGFERVLQLNPRGAKPLYQLADLADAAAAILRRAAETAEEGADARRRSRGVSA